MVPTNPMKTDVATAMIAIATALMPANPMRTYESFRFSRAINRSIGTSASAPRIVCRSISVILKISSPPSIVLTATRSPGRTTSLRRTAARSASGE